jgi:VanZ family protein
MGVTVVFDRFWLIIGVLQVAVVFWLSLAPKPPQPFQFDMADKVSHLAAYALLMWWFSVTAARNRQRIFYAAYFVLMGVVIEILQGMSGYRHFQVADMLANVAGVAAGWLMCRHLAPRHFRSYSPPESH